MTRKEERRNRREKRKAKRTKSIMLIMAIISLFQWWMNRGDAEAVADPPADTTLKAVYDPDQPLTPENYDPDLYRVSKGEWGVNRRQDGRTGTIYSRKVWVPEGGLMRTTKRDFSGPREPCKELRNSRQTRAFESEKQIPDQSNYVRGGRACLS